MAYFTEVLGVIFTEESFDLTVLMSVSGVAATQNTNLSEVKADLARKAVALGGNGVMNFKYSQKADSPLRNIFSFKWDTERIRATGDVVIFDSDPRK